MRISNIKNCAFGLMLLAGTSVMSSCYKYGNERLAEYLIEKDCTQNEFDSIMNCTKRYRDDKTVAASQAFLDSMAYRELFNQTKLAQDSDAVAAFNNLARIKVEDFDINPSSGKSDGYEIREKVKEALFNDLKKRNNKMSVIRNVTENFPLSRLLDFQKQGTMSDIAQFYTDHYYYGELFKQQGLMNDSTFQDAFEKVSEKIKPE